MKCVKSSQEATAVFIKLGQTIGVSGLYIFCFQLLQPPEFHFSYQKSIEVYFGKTPNGKLTR